MEQRVKRFLATSRGKVLRGDSISEDFLRLIMSTDKGTKICVARLPKDYKDFLAEYGWIVVGVGRGFLEIGPYLLGKRIDAWYGETKIGALLLNSLVKQNSFREDLEHSLYARTFADFLDKIFKECPRLDDEREYTKSIRIH